MVARGHAARLLPTEGSAARWELRARDSCCAVVQHERKYADVHARKALLISMRSFHSRPLAGPLLSKPSPRGLLEAKTCSPHQLRPKNILVRPAVCPRKLATQMIADCRLCS